MYNFSRDGITICSMLDIRKANKDKKFPVKIRVTFRRDRLYYPTGKYMTSEEWEKLPSTKTRAATELRQSIQVSFESVQKVSASLIEDGHFSFESLNMRLGKSVTGTVNNAFKAKIDSLKEETRVGTQLYYANILSSIERFNGTSIPFSSITPDWLKRYEKWNLKNKASYASIGMYMRGLRAIINEAKREGAIKESDYPFGRGRYEIPTGEARKLALNMAQIKQVIDFNDGLEATARYRDLWFLSYLTNGANLGDLINLKYSNIRDGEIRFLRAKTIRTTKKKKEIVAVLTPEIDEIIQKWGNPDKRPENLIFPYLTGKETPLEHKKKVLDVIRRVNKKLKLIGDSIGISNFTSYSARHSYATVLKRSGANIAYISESLGHPDVKTTETYLDSFEKDERLKNAKMLTNFEETNK